eukprot:TRINITY_DN3200_c0_g2_i1.p1 TRINITY_DN3200_c0_g2~~TRINITY_DN3200_c0_g2_i1.p1  ORF type:complete len:304 (+),score=68.84 TRINITY_DN3200_c0_g2_i1:99-914(+)
MIVQNSCLYRPSQTEIINTPVSEETMVWHLIDRKQFLLPPPRPVRVPFNDNIDSKCGLHGYTIALTLRTAGHELLYDTFHDVFTNVVDPTSGLANFVLSGEDLVTSKKHIGIISSESSMSNADRHMTFNHPIGIKWKTGLFSGSFIDQAFLDLTVIGEDQHIMIQSSRVVTVDRSGQLIAPLQRYPSSYQQSENNALIIASEPNVCQTIFHIVQEQDDESEDDRLTLSSSSKTIKSNTRSHITNLQLAIDLTFLDQHWGTNWSDGNGDVSR